MAEIAAQLNLFCEDHLVNNLLSIAHPIHYQEKKEPTADEAGQAIANSNSIYFTAFEKGDSSIFINRYAVDCHIMAPNMISLSGKEGAAIFYKMAYQDFGVRGGHFETEKIYGTGLYRTEEGRFFLLDAQNKPIDDGKYLVLWQKTPDGWKMFRDCFNSNHLPQQKNHITDEKKIRMESPDTDRVYRYPVH